MALDYARDAYHRQRQEQLSQEAAERLSFDTLSTQSQSLGRRFKQASSMEAQPSHALDEETATYDSPNASQSERYGRQTIQFPPRTSSNQRIAGNTSPATSGSERFRGSYAYSHSPATPQARSTSSQQMATNLNVTSSPNANTANERLDRTPAVSQIPTTQRQISTPLANKTDEDQRRDTSFYQTPSEYATSTTNSARRGTDTLSDEYNVPDPVSNFPRASRVEVDEGVRGHHSPTQRSSPRTQGSSTPQGHGSREPRTYQNSASEQSSRNADQQGSTETTQEAGEVINRMVISDPAVDVKREEERIEEIIPGGSHEDTAPKVTKRRQDFSASASKRKEAKFGEYILGQTLGEGEFGKVKLGWKKDGSVEVAIKLIRRENLNSNPTRLSKIYREVKILQGLQHPNIVRLHEMLETDRYIGIVMECASGGELFDYILLHRYLKDGPAKKLFAQLISGVGYLHKVGIVHRDLKLENLLLDRNRNIIITDFGFANTFDPADDLDGSITEHITDKGWVKKYDLDRINRHTGLRRGDLMATSCGSPCYAAPELVVTDSLYTGRKVDVWSCGVILVGLSFQIRSFSANETSSTLCSPAIYHLMTIQPIPKAIISTSCTSTSSRHLSPFRNTSLHIPEIF